MLTGPSPKGPEQKKTKKMEEKMLKRRKVGRRKSKKLFRNTARPVSKMNRRKGIKGLKRGGTRL